MNRNGVLSLTELRPFARQFGVCTPDDLSRFAYRMDTSGSGEIRLNDFVKYMWKQLEGDCEEGITEVLRSLLKGASMKPKRIPKKKKRSGRKSTESSSSSDK